ncbi:hypothetical protein CK203_071397 [Vitis vinifera]|uniref:Uncharacterized protein n=1 Tax=Vitis vinifera TaxID=29760 RepID=A0A438F3P2_VITVI|nr:hypothetical protein CK203_071397 [Vitis vinifera]
MGCSVLSLLFNLDLSLLEVLFVYSKGKNDIFSMSAHLPSLQLVTELPDSTKGRAKGHVLVRGAWAGLLGHPERPFSPNHSLVLPGPDKRGRVVEWVEKASFEPAEQKLRKRRALLDDREGRRKEGTLRKAPSKKRSAPSLPTGTPAKKKKKKKNVSNKGKEVKLPTPPKNIAPMAPPTEDMGAENQGLPPCEPSPLAFVPVKGPTSRRSRPTRDLKSGLVGRLQERFLETIEVSCSSAR